MIRIAITSCFVVMSIAGSASAGLWDAATVSYPTTHYAASSEYMAASAQAAAVYGGGCGCSQPSYGYNTPSTDCCSNVWAGYCSERRGCRPKIHTRYHWFAKPSCGCEVSPAPCCGSVSMVNGCGNACPSCLGMHKRGYWGRCRGVYDCGYPTAGCSSCGDATEIISIEGEMEKHNVPQVAPEIEPTPAPPMPAPPKPEAQEARLWPSLHALMPRN